jgi:hypothetical protein
MGSKTIGWNLLRSSGKLIAWTNDRLFSRSATFPGDRDRAASPSFRLWEAILGASGSDERPFRNAKRHVHYQVRLNAEALQLGEIIASFPTPIHL